MTGLALARKVAKAAVLPGGLAQKRTQGDVTILLYHRVGSGNREIDLDRASFETQAAILAERMDVIALDDLVSEDESDGVVVTFDDGYRDFFDEVLPVLLRYQIPATLYLTTGNVGESADSSVDPSERLEWWQIKEAVETGFVTIGAHTHSHADLSEADGSTANREMRLCKELIESQVERPCRHFAYPWGVASGEAEEEGRSLFQTCALTWNTNRKGKIDLHRLGRTPVLRSDGRTFFKAKVEGRLDAEARFYRFLRRGPWRAR